ncbi:transmembrane and coiled-coil 2 domain protein [Ceratobasidium sp. AG-Ba]|nr:transmembrane and coiled-coil 2 domain protein [Ceratobasidium sp. AG-Ba]
MALTRGSRAETHFLGGVRRRADSGLGLARALHPRNRAQSRPRTSERPLAWARQDRPSTGDTSHHDPGEPPLTPVRSRSPFPNTGTPSGVRGRKVSGTEASSPTGHSSRGVRFPQGLYPFPLSRPASSLGIMRRRHSLSLSTDQLVPASGTGTGKRPATGMKRLARTAHLHEVEIEAQRRRRAQGESTARDNDSGDQKSQTVVYGLALSIGHKPSHGDGHSPTSNSIRHGSPPASQPSMDPSTPERLELLRPEQDNGAEWEDTDTDMDDSGHELLGES